MISKMFNYDNVGERIKTFTKWVCWTLIAIVWILSAVSFFYLLTNDDMIKLCWIPIVCAVIIPIIIWISSWGIYAFGQFVEDMHTVKKIMISKHLNEEYEYYDFEIE